MKPEDQAAFEAACNQFYYDSSSKTGIRWKYGNGVLKGPTKRNAGDVAGWFDIANGYCCVKYNGKAYKTHRIVLALNNIDVHDNFVDHIDGDRSNNVLENLRVVSISQNRKNTKIRSDNNSGDTGVSYNKTRNCWTARWTDSSGTERTKAYNVKKFGDEAFLLAVQYREKMISILKEAGHEYTERHGK